MRAIFNRPGSRRGFSRYLTTSLVELFRYRPQRLRVRLDGRTIDRDALMIVLANGTNTAMARASRPTPASTMG